MNLAQHEKQHILTRERKFGYKLIEERRAFNRRWGSRTVTFYVVRHAPSCANAHKELRGNKDKYNWHRRGEPDAAITYRGQEKAKDKGFAFAQKYPYEMKTILESDWIISQLERTKQTAEALREGIKAYYYGNIKNEGTFLKTPLINESRHWMAKVFHWDLDNIPKSHQNDLPGVRNTQELLDYIDIENIPIIITHKKFIKKLTHGKIVDNAAILKVTFKKNGKKWRFMTSEDVIPGVKKKDFETYNMHDLKGCQTKKKDWAKLGVPAAPTRPEETTPYCKFTNINCDVTCDAIGDIIRTDIISSPECRETKKGEKKCCFPDDYDRLDAQKMLEISSNLDLRIASSDGLFLKE